MSQCDGRCCASFTIPKYDRLVADPDTILDGRFLLDMLVPLTPAEDAERRARFGIDGEGGTTQRFTCRHWDEETRLCTVYDQRPAMCRDYPYEKPCEHGCGSCGGTALGRRRVEPILDGLAALEQAWQAYRDRYGIGGPDLPSA